MVTVEGLKFVRVAACAVAIATLVVAQTAASFELSMPGALSAPGPDPEGWLIGAGTSTVVPAAAIPGPSFGFPTDNVQWAIVSSAGALGNISPPPAGVPPPLPLPAGTSARLRIPMVLAAGATLTVQFDWTYVSLECPNWAPFNDFVTVDLTDASGVRLANLMYRDTFSPLVTPALTPNQSGVVPFSICAGGREEPPAGQPKTTTFAVPAALATGQTAYFEVNVGDANDVSFPGYLWIDDVRLSGGPPGTLGATLSQPWGTGSLRLVESGLVAGTEMFTGVSFEPAPGGPGTGPYLGLWTSNVAVLVAQVSLPLGSIPFHYVPSGPTLTVGPLFGVPVGLPVELVAAEWTGTSFGRVSSVASITTQ